MIEKGEFKNFLMVEAKPLFKGSYPNNPGIVFVNTQNTVLSDTFRIIFFMKEILHFKALFIKQVYPSMIRCNPDLSMLISYHSIDQVTVQCFRPLIQKTLPATGRAIIIDSFLTVQRIYP
ncbi:hypothetical protein D3C85_1142810 [compost metagenome]